jgi:hypothetical protein
MTRNDLCCAVYESRQLKRIQKRKSGNKNGFHCQQIYYFGQSLPPSSFAILVLNPTEKVLLFHHEQGLLCEGFATLKNRRTSSPRIRKELRIRSERRLNTNLI